MKSFQSPSQWDHVLFKNKSSTLIHSLLHQIYISSLCCVPGLLEHMWEHFTSHQILFLIFFFPYFMLFNFHFLPPGFGRGRCWQIKWTGSLLIRFFISPCIWITLLSKLNNPVPIWSQRKDQLREAWGRASLYRSRGSGLSLERVVKGTT